MSSTHGRSRLFRQRGLAPLLAVLAWLVGPKLAQALVFGEVDSVYSGGAPPMAASMTTGEDQVLLFSGELRRSATDAVVPGAYGLDLAITREYSSKIVDENLIVMDESWVGLGWTLMPGGRLAFDTTSTSHVWVDLPGAGRQRAALLTFRDDLYREMGDANAWPDMTADSDEQYVTQDLTFVYKVTGSTYYAITAEGLLYEFDAGAGPQWDEWTYGETVRNAHGDELTLAYDTTGQPGALSTVTDALGRQVVFHLDTAGFIDSATIPSEGGLTVAVDYDVVLASDGSGQYRLEEVVTPTGEATVFTYSYSSGGSGYGELTEVLLPAGGTVAYSYGTVDFLWAFDGSTETIYETRVVTEKSTFDGTTTATWGYAYECYYGGSTACTSTATGTDDAYRLVTVTAPDGGYVEHEFFTVAFLSNGSQAANYQLTGHPYTVTWYDSVGGFLRQERHDYWSGSSGFFGQVLELTSTTASGPFHASNETQLLFFVYQTQWSDSEAYPGGGTWKVDRNEVYGDALDHDIYGNRNVLCRLFYQPTYSGASLGSSLYIADYSESTAGWEAQPGLEGWNLVRLPGDTATWNPSSSVATSSACSASSGTLKTSGTTTWYESGARTGWPDTIVAHSTGESSTATLASTNPAPDETTYWDFTFTSSGVEAMRRDVDTSTGSTALRTTVYTYAYGAVEEVAYGLSGSAGTTLTRSIDSGTGRVTAEADANGNTTTFDYDDAGRLATVTPPVGDATTLSWAFAPSSYSATLTETTGTLVTTATYDGLGRQVRVDQPNGLSKTGADRTVTSLFELDELGRQARAYVAYDPDVGQRGYSEEGFDELGRVTDLSRFDSTGSLQSQTTHAWGVYSDTITDVFGRTTTHELDSLGNLARVTPPDGASLDSESLGKVAHVLESILTDPVSGATQGQARHLDGAGRMWLLDDDQSGERLLVRDAAGDLVTEFDSAGRCIVYEYTDRGEVEAVTYGAGSAYTDCLASATPDLTFEYDGTSYSSPSFTASNGQGALTRVQDPLGERRFSYDALGRIENSQQLFDAWPSLVADLDYSYDAEGNLASWTLELDDGSLVESWQSDATWDNGRLSQLDVTHDNGSTVTTQTLAEHIRWTSGGRPDSMLLGNGVGATTTTDDLGRTTSMDWSGAGIGFGLSYTWDAADQLTEETIDGHSHLYIYDDIGRLTTALLPGGQIEYGYDAFGNLVERLGGPYGGDLTLATFSGNQTSDWTYNASGEVVDDSQSTYTWHANGKPAASLDSTGGSGVAYTYDHEGRRVAARACRDLDLADPGGSGTECLVEVTLFDDFGRPIARLVDLDDSGTSLELVSVTFYLGQMPIAVFDVASGQYHWLHSDVRGSVVAVSDHAENLVERRVWTPYGIPDDTRFTKTEWLIPEIDGHVATALAPTWGAGFAHHSNFSPGGLIDQGARVYSNRIARFLSPDRDVLGDAADPQSFNRYGYGRMAPSSHVDLNGENPIVVVGAGAAAAWVYVEGGLTLMDVGTSIATTWRYATGAATAAEVATSWGLTGAGVVAPGGGYASIGKVMAKLKKGKVLATPKVVRRMARRVKRAVGNTTIYRAVDGAGNVTYVGITDDLVARARAHMSKVGRRITPIFGLKNLTRADAHAVEQALIELHGRVIKGGGTLDNINDSIRRTKPYYKAAVERGRAILRDVGYDGL